MWRKPRGARGGEGGRRRGRGFGKLRGKSRNFPELPPLSPPDHFSFPFAPLFLSLLWLSLAAIWFGRLGGILEVLYFRFSGTPLNGFQMCPENPCKFWEGLRGACWKYYTDLISTTIKNTWICLTYNPMTEISNTFHSKVRRRDTKKNRKWI